MTRMSAVASKHVSAVWRRIGHAMVSERAAQIE
jgi:hypothetical protein